MEMRDETASIVVNAVSLNIECQDDEKENDAYIFLYRGWGIRHIIMELIVCITSATLISWFPMAGFWVILSSSIGLIGEDKTYYSNKLLMNIIYLSRQYKNIHYKKALEYHAVAA